MAPEDVAHGGARLAGVALSLPVTLAFTTLGAGVLLGRRLCHFFSRLLSWSASDIATPHHDAGRVRERAAAAMQAARASGLLSRRRS
jgi:hypothetical protein